VQSFVFKRHPRTVFGYDDKGYAYMIVIDGRHKGNAAGATIPEAAFIARILGLEAALNLDGGGSSALWSDQTGVLNHPCDNKTFDHNGERRVPNIIIAR
jgi:exopolysaccharide biosynthesis protein